MWQAVTQNFEVNQVMAEKLFNALKATETIALGAMMVYGLPSSQSWTCGLGPIIPMVQALALGQSITLHSALSLGYLCLNIGNISAIV